MNKKLFFWCVLVVCLSCSKSPVPATMVQTSGVRFFGTEEGLSIHNFERTSDGGFLLSGYAISGTGQKQGGFLMKTDGAGDLQWRKIYGGAKSDYFYMAHQTSDGGYIAVGYTNSYGNGFARQDYFTDAWMVKTDGQGNMLWQKTFGSIFQDTFKDVKEMPDHGFVAVGVATDSNTAPPYNSINYPHYLPQFYAVRVDAQGNTVWTHEYFKEQYYGYAKSVDIAPSGNIAIAGSINLSTTGGLINNFYKSFILVSPDGNTEMVKAKQTDNIVDNPIKIFATDDGFTLGFNENTYSANLMKFDRNGIYVWQHSYPGQLIVSDINRDDQGGFTMSANNYSGTQSGQILKIDGAGNLLSTVTCPLTNSDIPENANPSILKIIGALPVRSGWVYAVYVRPMKLEGNVRFALVFTDDKGNIIENGN